MRCSKVDEELLQKSHENMEDSTSTSVIKKKTLATMVRKSWGGVAVGLWTMECKKAFLLDY